MLQQLALHPLRSFLNCGIVLFCPGTSHAILFESEHISHFKAAGVVRARGKNIYTKKRYIPIFPVHKHPSVLLSMLQTSGFRSLDSQCSYSWG